MTKKNGLLHDHILTPLAVSTEARVPQNALEAHADISSEDLLLLSPRRAESFNSLNEYAALSDDNDSDDSRQTTKPGEKEAREPLQIQQRSPPNNDCSVPPHIPKPSKVSAAIIHEEFEEPAFYVVIITYFAFLVLEIFGHIRSTLERLGILLTGVENFHTCSQRSFLMLPNMEFLTGIYRRRKKYVEVDRKGYAPLYDSWEAFFTQQMYTRIRDCWNRPISSCPGAESLCMERVTHDYGWTFEATGRQLNAINMGSYNYLGFAQSTGPCAEKSREAIERYSVSICSPRNEVGTTKLHIELEKLVAEFLGVEDAVTFGMGYATNSCNIPALLMGKNCLVISDELNHASLVMGCKLSG